MLTLGPLVSLSSPTLLSHSPLLLNSPTPLLLFPLRHPKGCSQGLGLVFAYAGTYKPDRLLRALHLFRHERLAKKT